MNGFKSFSLSRHSLEFYFLLGFVFSLPLFRSPQSIFFIAYALIWLLNRHLEQSWGGAWKAWDSLIAFWILANISVDIAGVLHGVKWTVISDFARYSILLWIISRSYYSQKQLSIVLLTLVSSTLIALLSAYYPFLIQQSMNALELHGVGHVNHSAIYLTLVFIIGSSFTLAYWSSLKTAQKIAAIIITGLLLQGVFISQSRAAAGASLLILLLTGIILLRRNARYLISILLILMCLGVYSWVYPPKVLERIVKSQKAEHTISFALAEHTLSAKILTHLHILIGSDRANVYQTAVWSYQHHPWFGAGIHQFQSATVPVVKEEEQRLHLPSNRYTVYSHAHNLYLNTLVEQGLVGFIPLCLIFIAWGILLASSFPKRSSSSFHWCLFLASTGVFFTNLGIGFVNTPLHHQNALLSLFILGLSIRYLPLAPKRS